MNPETFEQYCVRHPGDADVVPLTGADVEELRPVVLDHMNHVAESEDPRVQALGLLAYERSGSGTRSYASSVDAVLSELVADGDAPADAADDSPDEGAGAAAGTDKPAAKKGGKGKAKKAAAAAPAGDVAPAKGE